MTKVLIQKVFDTAQIANTRAYAELQRFFDYFSQLVDNVVRITRNGIGVTDNMDAAIFNVPATHDAPFDVRVRGKPLSLTLVASDLALATPIYWQPTPGNSASVTVTVRYLEPTQGNNQPAKGNVTLIAQYT